MFWCIRLCGTSWVVWILDYVEAVEAGIEADVANPEAGDDCVQGTTGSVGPSRLAGR